MHTVDSKDLYISTPDYCGDTIGELFYSSFKTIVDQLFLRRQQYISGFDLADLSGAPTKNNYLQEGIVDVICLIYDKLYESQTIIKCIDILEYVRVSMLETLPIVAEAKLSKHLA